MVESVTVALGTSQPGLPAAEYDDGWRLRPVPSDEGHRVPSQRPDGPGPGHRSTGVRAAPGRPQPHSGDDILLASSAHHGLEHARMTKAAPGNLRCQFPVGRSGGQSPGVGVSHGSRTGTNRGSRVSDVARHDRVTAQAHRLARRPSPLADYMSKKGRRAFLYCANLGRTRGLQTARLANPSDRAMVLIGLFSPIYRSTDR